MNYLFMIVIALFAIISVPYSFGSELGKHLFIISGQSNMEGLDPTLSFIPTVEHAFESNHVIVVKDAQGAQPIRRWYKKWKPAHADGPKTLGDLYDRLMTKVRLAIKDTAIKTVTFVWMQGERDAKERHGEVYADSLKGLINQLRGDLGRADANFVIGRLSDFDMNNKKFAHWTMVRNAQVAVANSNPNVAWVNTDDLNDGNNQKGQTIQNDLHYSVEGYRILGQRFANKAIQLINNPSNKELQLQ